MMRKVHATIPYTIEGRQTVVGPDGKQGSWGVGGQVLLFFTLRDAKRCAAACRSSRAYVLLAAAACRVSDWC